MTQNDKIPIFRPSMDEKEIEAVKEVLESGWWGLGSKTEKFEEKFSKRIGVEHAVAMSSGTDALRVSLASLPIERGDEIITSPITFVSTAHVILQEGAKPVFADVKPTTLNIDPGDVREKVTENTKGIIPVHFGGHPCEMDEIMEIADENNLYVIEDAAHACGAEYKSKMAGSIGDLGCFSFHAVKNLATGDGGMITCDDDDLVEMARKLRWLGIDKSTHERESNEKYSWDYDVKHLGFKSHMNDILASIGLVQLKKLEEKNEERRRLAKRYDKSFEDMDWIKPLDRKDHVKNSQHNYVVKLSSENRNELIKHLSEHGISAGVHYKPLYLHTYYQERGIKADCPKTDEVWERIVTLPLYPDLTETDQDKIIQKVKEFKK